jgi:hypothetical protein
MSYFLLTFDRPANGAPRIERYEDGDEALAHFTDAERRVRAEGADRGVVLLVADSEETLRKTHSHYFYTVDELLAQLPS